MAAKFDRAVGSIEGVGLLRPKRSLLMSTHLSQVADLTDGVAGSGGMATLVELAVAAIPQIRLPSTDPRWHDAGSRGRSSSQSRG